MQTVPLKLITIVSEPVLTDRITAELRKLGAQGWTVTEGRGEGTRGLRASELPGVVSRIETVVSEAVAQKILDHVAQAYFPRYAVIAFVSTVEVVRGEKYV
jgi:nitrogen regulatory protein P-II 2